MISVRSLHVHFGGVVALEDVSLDIPRDIVTGIIGPNGAGKSTLLNCITGYYRPLSGGVTIDGMPTTHKSCRSIAALGVSRTFQNLELFAEQSVFDNIAFGAIRRMLGAFAPAGWSRWRSHAREVTAAVYDVANQLDLVPYLHVLVRELPYALKKQVELARALTSHPKVLLLDEPTAGLGVKERATLIAVLAEARNRFGFTAVVIAHDMPLIFDTCDHIYVLDHGRVCAAGSPAAVRKDETVRAVYLGE